MNKNYLYVLPLALAIAAFSLQGIADNEMECKKDPVKTQTPRCEGNSQAPVVNLNLKKLEANPQCISAREGTFLIFKLKGDNELELNAVEIRPLDRRDYWLAGKNDREADRIYIEVPGEYKNRGIRPTTHDYSIYAPNGCLDPRVEVQH